MELVIKDCNETDSPVRVFLRQRGNTVLVKAEKQGHGDWCLLEISDKGIQISPNVSGGLGFPLTAKGGVETRLL